MRPVAVKLLWHTDSTYKGKMTLGCPAVIARPHSQPAVAELYYASREGSSVSEPQEKFEFCCSRKRMKLLPGTGHGWLVPFHPCTHPHTHTQTFFPSWHWANPLLPHPLHLEPCTLSCCGSPQHLPCSPSPCSLSLRCLLHPLFWPKWPCKVPQLTS